MNTVLFVVLVLFAVYVAYTVRGAQKNLENRATDALNDYMDQIDDLLIDMNGYLVNTLLSDRPVCRL